MDIFEDLGDGLVTLNRRLVIGSDSRTEDLGGEGGSSGNL